MYISNLKKLREDADMTQEELAQKLNVKRARYGFWENDRIMIPLLKADYLSVLYQVKLSYILGSDKKLEHKKIKPIDYDKLLTNLNNLKKVNKYSYETIAIHLNCNKSTCQRYFKGAVIIPIDRLIQLSELFKIDIDKLCGK